MNPEIEKELEKLKIELDIAQARYDLASHFAGMDKPKPENFPDGWETEWQPSCEAGTISTKPAPQALHARPVPSALRVAAAALNSHQVLCVHNSVSSVPLWFVSCC